MDIRNAVSLIVLGSASDAGRTAYRRALLGTALTRGSRARGIAGILQAISAGKASNPSMSKDGEVAITLLAVAAETVFHTALMRDLMLSGNMRDVDLDRTLTVAFKLASTGEMSPEMREAVKNRMTALKLDLEHLRTNQTGDVFFMTDREDPHGLMA